jgi:hypothetical protein
LALQKISEMHYILLFINLAASNGQAAYLPNRYVSFKLLPSPFHFSLQTRENIFANVRINANL